MNAIEQAAVEYAKRFIRLYSRRIRDIQKESFKAGAEWALSEVRKDLCRELTNICDFDVYVEPSYYEDSINSIIENIDKFQE